MAVGTTSGASFTISSASTTAQTLGAGAGQTGTITATGALTVSGGTVAVTISGNNATLTNLGILQQTGTGRAIRDNTGVTGLTITNGSVTNSTALMQTADADVIQMNVANGSVTLHNYGLMSSLNASGGGSQAVDFSAITSGANVINNYATGIMQAVEADAVRPGVNGVVYNAGLMKSISTTGSSSDGVDAQSNTGVQVTNDTTGVIEGARHGITGGAATATVTFTTSVTNDFGGIIKGDNGSGINLDGFNANQTATIINNGTITGNGHDFSGNLVSRDGDGIDVDGVVSITNTGIIRSINAFSIPADGVGFSEGITVGGGTIINSGTIEGLVAAGNTNAVGRGITLAGNDITSGPLAGTREAIYANATITNQSGGLIRGQSDSAIAVDGPASGFTVVINNNAGATIRGGGSSTLLTAAIRTGADNDTINNAGMIDGSSDGLAINMGAGNNTLKITGGSILGSIDGGVGGTNAMIVDVGAANRFTLSGSVSDFNTVEVKSGALSLGASNEFDSLENLILSGGTFDLNNFSEGAAGMAGIGNFFLSANSTLDFGDLGLGSNMVAFGGVGTHVVGTLLQVADYDFGSDHLFFTGSASDFISQYAQTDVCFDDRCGYRTISSNGYFEVLQVPEPMTLSLVVVGLAGLGYRRRTQVQRLGA